jgi:hypothetical protein
MVESIRQQREDKLMNNVLTTFGRKIGLTLVTATLLLGMSSAMAQEVKPDDSLTGWLGREFTVDTVTASQPVPIGGKLTFIFDSDDNSIRICTRTVAAQKSPWTMDLAVPCNVAMKFTKGTRYCTIEDVKTGNAEVLSNCHRLRSHDVALRPSSVKGAVEVSDVIAFPGRDADGRLILTILVDSPSRVTGDGIIVVKG